MCGRLGGMMDELDQQALADYMPRLEDWPDGKYPANDAGQKQSMATRQAAFLLAYSTMGTVTGAAKVVQSGRDQVYYWQQRDSLGFNRRFRLAQEAFVDYLEELAFERIANPNHNGRIGSDGLLSHALNAHSGRWRGPGPAAQAEVGEVMKAILSMARSAPKVVDGGQDAPALPAGGG